jgi:uncharacterized membrane protein YhdT
MVLGVETHSLALLFIGLAALMLIFWGITRVPPPRHERDATAQGMVDAAQWFGRRCPYLAAGFVVLALASLVVGALR